MGKNKEEKKRKSGVFLETAPACVLTCENFQKDQLQTTTDKESFISVNLESSSEKPKKKQKRKRLSEQQAENDCSTEQHTEGHQNDRKKKKKTKLRNEEVSHVEDTNAEDVELSTSTEEAHRKKKKRKKTKEVNEAKELETQSSERSEETQTAKKKKKLKVSKEIISENRTETEEVNLTVESEIRSTEDLKKKKKKKKSADKGHDSLAGQHMKVQSVSVTEETGRDEEADMGTKTEEFTEVDPRLLNELKEFVPNIKSKEPVHINKMIKYDLPRFKEFKKHGLALNFGRFTAQENERLRKNVRDFMVLTAIDNATKLFFTHRFKQERENIRKLKGLHKFFERIAEGIPRSCYYVYARGRRMFDEQNYQGQFSKDELHMLNKLHTLHGNNWKKISELTGRSAFSLQKRYTQIAIKEGPWSKKEVQRLLRAVRDHIVSQIPGGASSNGSIRVMKETLYKRLPLQKIAERVKTRSWTQCREKWMGILAVKMSFGAVCTEKKSLDVQVKLIKGMNEMNVDDAAHVDWEDLTALIGDVPPAYLQRKWHKLKVCHVPGWQSKCFADIVDFLYEKVLPELKQKLMSYKDLDKIQHTENDDESYLLSTIFQDINEDDNDDEEEEGKKNSNK